MMDFRPTFFVVGWLLIVLAAAMVLPVIADIAAQSADWQAFAAAGTITAFTGVSLVLAFRFPGYRLTVRHAFVLTTASWVVLCAFAGLPFLFSDLGLGAADAYFEAMSGLTTTGSTVLTGLDVMPPGILLWRALLQWLGGIGIIVMAVAILPILRIGGMQLFRTESSDQAEKLLPRAAGLATAIGRLYLVLTIIIIAALWLAGMPGFDALCHGMTTIATGGFSTHDNSIGHFDSATIDTIVIVGMIIGSLPFVRYLQALQGQPGGLWADTQIRWFAGFCALAVLVFALWQWQVFDNSPGTALRYAAFNVIAVITGTGYATASYDQWGSLPMTLMFFFMFVGGCTGSTTGGIKVFRYQVMFAAARVRLRRLVQPRGVFVVHYNRQPVSDSVQSAVLSLFFMFFAAFVIVALALAGMGLDFVTSVSGAATAIANVGPGLGPMIGPSGNFAALPDAAKWLLSATMLLGRLELFTVLVLVLPSFWRD